ncbi:MAG TPA: tetratricopeptide repeat protein [Tahibacter sp.]|uniref:tetratricopeptide repeat protein n=1 Tax=Tahibacter sp. TaxID=2056211 RepID=UPI002C3EDD6B|nr:tetratricopeptide repeat protein [Tahibacter sp.]HSX62997.1 tetratricopeptide repeat protein [Tahibacter sp.]
MNTPTIVPFWQRLREISLYPSQTGALITLVVLSLARVLGLLPGVGRIVTLLVTIALYKFAFEILRATANGSMEPPENTLDMDESVGRMGVLLQAAFIVMAFLSFFIGYLLFGDAGLFFGLATTLLLLLGWPGACMSLAIDQNFWHALNPATWMQIMSRLGWPYFLAYGLMTLIFLSAANAQALLEGFVPLLIGLPLFYFISGYALLATFHLMGYLVWQYQDELGFTPDAAPLPLINRNADPDQFILDEVAQMVRDGETDLATDALRAHLRERGGTEAVHTQYRKLLRLKGDTTELVRHGKEWLPMLLAQDREKAAVELFRELVELDPSYAVTDAESNTRLANRAAALGQTQLALRLISGFHKRHPKSADIPQMYLLAARLLSERMGKDAEAKALLTQIRTAYPNHALMPEVDALTKLIDSLGAKKPATT